MKKLLALALVCAFLMTCTCSAESGTMYVSQKKGLIIRSDNDLESGIVGCIPHGEAVAVTGRKGYFYHVNYRGTEGYVWAEYLTNEDLSRSDERTMFVSAWAGLIMRMEDDLESAVITALDFAAEVTVTEQGRFFSKCTAVQDGKTYTGYLWTGYLTDSVPDADEAQRHHEELRQSSEDVWEDDWEW